MHLTGTYKLQKTELQKEGFDVNTIADPVFFMGPKVKKGSLKDTQASMTKQTLHTKTDIHK